MEFTAKQISDLLEGEILGDGEVKVNTLAKIEEGKKGAITFLANPKYEPYIYDTQASVVVRNRNFLPKQKIHATQIIVEDAYSSFTKLLNFYQKTIRSRKTGIEQPSYIHERAKLGESIYIGAFAYISEGAVIGDEVSIYPNCYIGENAVIGAGTVIHPGTTIYHDTVIGKNCTIFSNCTIGADGFGYAKNNKGEYEKIPQIGNVVIEDNVDIGASSTIDRATMGATLIKKGAKLDNQIQIAHNVQIGENTVIASQAGIAGSTKIGDDVIIGGQAGIVGHLNIGNKSSIQAQSGVDRNLKEGERVYGSPAIDYMGFKRAFVYFRKFPSLVKRLEQIEAILKAEKTNG